MKVYLTKYALTAGIQEIEGKIDETTPNVFCHKQLGFYINYYYKPHWHLTLPEAIEQANKMRAKKLQSLKDQIQKIESIEFNPVS